MNKIVREHYPAARLPDDLREGLDPAAQVNITIEEICSGQRPNISDVLASRRPPYRTADQIDADLRLLRDEWDRHG